MRKDFKDIATNRGGECVEVYAHNRSKQKHYEYLLQEIIDDQEKKVSQREKSFQNILRESVHEIKHAFIDDIPI